MEVEQKKRGPKKKFGPRQEVHLKFSSEVMKYIEAHAHKGYQNYFDELIKRDMETSQKKGITWDYEKKTTL